MISVHALACLCGHCTPNFLSSCRDKVFCIIIIFIIRHKIQYVPPCHSCHALQPVCVVHQQTLVYERCLHVNH